MTSAAVNSSPANQARAPFGHVLNFAFDRLTLADFKSVIPEPDRAYDARNREWSVERRHWGVLNALFDLKTVFFLSNPFGPTVPTVAVDMPHATGIPAIFWTVIWIALALGILWFAMRLYVAGRDKSYQPDLPFEETPPI